MKIILKFNWVDDKSPWVLFDYHELKNVEVFIPWIRNIKISESMFQFVEDFWKLIIHVENGFVNKIHCLFFKIRKFWDKVWSCSEHIITKNVFLPVYKKVRIVFLSTVEEFFEIPRLRSHLFVSWWKFVAIRSIRHF